MKMQWHLSWMSLIWMGVVLYVGKRSCWREEENIYILIILGLWLISGGHLYWAKSRFVCSLGLNIFHFRTLPQALIPSSQIILERNRWALHPLRFTVGDPSKHEQINMFTKLICWKTGRTDGYRSFLSFHTLENKQTTNTMNPEGIMLREINQYAEMITAWFQSYEVSKRANLIETESGIVVARGKGGGGGMERG